MSTEEQSEGVEKSVAIDDFFTMSWNKLGFSLSFARVTNNINPKTGKLELESWQTYHGNLRQTLNKYLDSSLEPLSVVNDILVRLDEIEAKIALLENKLKGQLR